MIVRFIVVFCLALLLGCKSTQTSMIIADNYDEKTNITTLILRPYGNIDIPGHWKKTKYLETSKQHFFEDIDSTSIAVAKAPQAEYSFYSDTMSDGEFAKEFFRWDSGFYKENGYKPERIETGTNGDYVVWKVMSKNINTILLYGGKDKFAYNFGVFSNSWTDEQKINFLIELFKNN